MSSTQKAPRDKKFSQQKATGSHYTPHELARFVAQEMIKAYRLEHLDSPVSIMDPAVGDGELLHAILSELSHTKRIAAVAGYDTDPRALSAAHKRLTTDFSDIKLSLSPRDFLDTVALAYGDSDMPLFPRKSELYDLVIANPPYVRTQVMGAPEAQRLAKQFGLTGRVDLYHAFLEGISMVLKEGGIAGVICSNRFMTTRSGLTVRQRLAEQFDILHVWDLGDTKIFEAAVLPAVLLLKKKGQSKHRSQTRFTSIYTAPGGKVCQSAPSPIAALRMQGFVAINGEPFQVREGILNSENASSVWALSNSESEHWLNTVTAHTKCTFGHLGKIRVGVKTTADKVFIRTDWDDIPEKDRPELLKPLITHHLTRPFRCSVNEKASKILYTHEVVNGKRRPVNLTQFPNTARYLEGRREVLEARNYVIEAGRKWFEIWVPQNPDAWILPKLVFPDISEKPAFCIDLQGSVVNGDCYWISAETKANTELLWLALAVANSSFILEFYDHRFHNKLYSGRRRFMTQYVEQFPLPDPTTRLSKDIVQKTKRVFEEMETNKEGSSVLIQSIDALVWKSFGLTKKE